MDEHEIKNMLKKRMKLILDNVGATLHVSLFWDNDGTDELIVEDWIDLYNLDCDDTSPSRINDFWNPWM